MDNINDYIFIAQTRKEAVCYSLPYGGIGFASHIITYYQMIVLILGRKPLRPWKHLEHRWWDLALAIAQLVATIILTSIVIHKCHDEWPFMLMAVWMLTTSVSAAALNMAGPLIAGGRKLGPAIVVAVGALWVCGCIVGCVGLITIVDSHTHVNHRFFIISCVFGTIIFLGVLIGWCICYCRGDTGVACSFCILWPLVGCCTLGLLWMDWSLGAILGNLAGVPSKTATSIYWSYVVVKRLGLLST
jgi:hypothetical protein